MDAARCLAACLAAACCALQPAGAHAAEEEWRLQLDARAATDLSEDTELVLQASQRFRPGDDQVLLRASVDHDIGAGFAIGTGLAYVFSAGREEFLPHQQVSYTRDGFSVRVRLEERVFSGENRMAMRLRARLGYATGLGKSWSLRGSGEWFYTARQADLAVRPRTDQWRGRLDLRKGMSDRLAIEAGYQLSVSPRGPDKDRVAHVPRLTLRAGF